VLDEDEGLVLLVLFDTRLGRIRPSGRNARQAQADPGAAHHRSRRPGPPLARDDTCPPRAPGADQEVRGRRLRRANWQRPGITQKARENLLNFVKGGKGLVSFHFSCRAWEDWPEYRNLIGRIWTTGSGHGPRGKFTSKVLKPDHPITAGLPAEFEADDELYSKLVGDAPIEVLVEAYSNWSKKVEPLAWTLTYGQGRVFNIVYGHDARACRNPHFARMLRQGTEWVARKP
jgi:type 1 glutamine amidotransferase